MARLLLSRIGKIGGVGEIRVTNIETLDEQKQPIRYLASGKPPSSAYIIRRRVAIFRNCRIILTVRKTIDRISCSYRSNHGATIRS